MRTPNAGARKTNTSTRLGEYVRVSQTNTTNPNPATMAPGWSTLPTAAAVTYRRSLPNNRVR
jgi:hypothetical protein